MKKAYFALLFLLVSMGIVAQNPNWSVNASDFQYSMTFAAFLNVNGTTLSSTNDQVAAFVNGEVRGVANLTYVENLDKYIAYLSVYSSTSGEAISFKIFESASQQVTDIAATQNFIIDGNVGGAFQSYSLANPALSAQAELLSFSFKGVESVSQNATASSVAIVLPVGTDLTSLTPVFELSTGARLHVAKQPQTSGVTQQDFSETIRYELLSENEAVLKLIDVQVSLDEVEAVLPEIVLSSDAPFRLREVPIRIDLSSNTVLSDVSVEEVMLSNAILASVTKTTSTSWVLEVMPIQQGAFSVVVPENKFFNAQSQGNTASNTLGFDFDLVPPALTAIKRKNPASEQTTSDVVVFSVEFNEAVTGINASSFESFADAVIEVTNMTEESYEVRVSNIASHQGVLSLFIVPGHTIKDMAGNALLQTRYTTYEK